MARLALHALCSALLSALLTPIGWSLRWRTDYSMTRMARRLGALFWYLFPKRRALGLTHIQRALGQDLELTSCEETLRLSYTHLGLTVLNALRRASERPERGGGARLNTELTVIGEERLQAALDAGGVIFISAHLGDWEALLTYHQRLDRELLLLSKRLSNPLAQALWDRSRSSAPRRLDQGARARQLIEHLKSGGCVADVLDQHDPRAKARRLLFFGREASTSPDAVILAERSGASIVPIFTWRGPLPQSRAERLTHTVWIGAALRPRELKDHAGAWEARDRLLRECLRLIEVHVTQRPEQWLWIHRRWKAPKASKRSNRRSGHS